MTIVAVMRAVEIVSIDIIECDINSTNPFAFNISFAFAFFCLFLVHLFRTFHSNFDLQVDLRAEEKNLAL